jgi:hypothetical protein
MPLGHRQLPPFERKPKPSPTVSQKSKKRWSKIQEKTLLEGVEKYCLNRFFSFLISQRNIHMFLWLSPSLMFVHYLMMVVSLHVKVWQR